MNSEVRQHARAAAAQATQTSIRSASRTGNLAKKVATPTLSNPDSLTIAEFRDWKVRLRDFMDLNDGGNELRHPDSLHAFLRSVLDTGRTRLWTAGRLGISPGVAGLVQSRKGSKVTIYCLTFEFELVSMLEVSSVDQSTPLFSDVLVHFLQECVKVVAWRYA